MTQRLLLPLFAVLAAGCTEISPYLPKVSFNRLDVDGVDWDGAQTQFVFDINNPNPIDVNLARFDYSLAFEGIEWLSGDDPDGLTLGASGSSEVALPVDIVWADVYDVVQATRGEDNILFGLAGSFGFNTPAGVLDFPYDEEGDFPALRRPTFAYDRLRVADLSLTTADIEIDLNVDNDHESVLDFTNFDYDISIEGYDVGSGLIDDLGLVDGATTGTLTIPLEIDLLSAGSAVYSALTTSRVNLGLVAASDVETPFGVVPIEIDENGNISIQ